MEDTVEVGLHGCWEKEKVEREEEDREEVEEKEEAEARYVSLPCCESGGSLEASPSLFASADAS
jgi:hypothetical protein